MPPRSSHTMLPQQVQGKPQIQEYPGADEYEKYEGGVTPLGDDIWEGCKENYRRSWAHHGVEEKVRQYSDAD